MPTIDNWRDSPLSALRAALEAMGKTVAMHDDEWTSREGDVNEWGTLCYEIDCVNNGISEVATAYGPTTAAYIAAANPATIRALLAERDALAAEVAALRAEVASLKEPDMFWDESDPERFAHSIQEIASDYGPGEAVRIDQAHRLPSISIRTGNDDPCEFDVVDAAMKAKP